MALKVRKVADTFNAIFAKREIQLPYFPLAIFTSLCYNNGRKAVQYGKRKQCLL